jgi:hypothetical protein|tara:strand:- start:470 stop:697 length:228 start_codon:yes stop_codon:yes gene_type:complete
MVKKIVEYKMIARHSNAEFVEAVNDQIRYGWQPYGNPFTIESWLWDEEKEEYSDENVDYFSQAIVKYGETPLHED